MWSPSPASLPLSASHFRFPPLGSGASPISLIPALGKVLWNDLGIRSWEKEFGVLALIHPLPGRPWVAASTSVGLCSLLKKW